MIRKRLSLALAAVMLFGASLRSEESAAAKTFSINGWDVVLESSICIARDRARLTIWAPSFRISEWRDEGEGAYVANLLRAKDGNAIFKAEVKRFSDGKLHVSFTPAQDVLANDALRLSVDIDESLAGSFAAMDGEMMLVPEKPAKVPPTPEGQIFKAAKSYEFYKGDTRRCVKLTVDDCAYSYIKDCRALRGDRPFEIVAGASREKRIEMTFDLSLSKGKASAGALGVDISGADPALPNFAACKNLVQNPSFEGGFECWGLGIFDNFQDPPAFGPGGWKPFEKDSSTGSNSAEYTVATKFRPPMLCSYPFPTEPEHVYTVSFSAKTDKPGSAIGWAVLSEDWSAWASTGCIKASTEWKRYSFLVKAPRRFLRICFGDYIEEQRNSIDGAKVWLDDVQCEEGEKATEFAQKPIFCSCTLDGKDNIAFAGEPSVLKVRATNCTPNAAPVRIKVQIKDMFGELLTEFEFSAVLAAWNSAEKTFDLAKLNRGGLFRIGMEAELNGFKEVFYGRVALCRAIDRALPFRYAFHDEKGPAPELISWFKRLGYGGSLSFQPPENPAVILNYEKQGWKHIFTPVESPDCPVKVFKQTMSDADWDAFSKWLDGRIKPYEDMPVWWKTFNEPNCGFDYTWTPSDYVKGVKIMSSKLKNRSASRAMMLTPDPYNAERDGQSWLEKFLVAGGKDFVDAIAIHTYRARPESPDLDFDIQALKRIKAAAGLSKAPILFTEGEGASLYTLRVKGKDISPFTGFAFYGLGLFSNDVGPSERAAGAMIARTLLPCLKNADEVKMYLAWTEDVVNGRPTAKLVAANFLLWLLGDANFICEHAVGNDSKVYVFKTNDNHPVAVMWNYDIKVEREEKPVPLVRIPLPEKGCRILDMVGNPLRTERNGKDVIFPLGGCPIYIVGDSQDEDTLNACLESARIGNESVKPVEIRFRAMTVDEGAFILTNKLPHPVSGALSIKIGDLPELKRQISLESKGAARVKVSLPGELGAFNAKKIKAEFKAEAGGGASTYEDDFRWFAIQPLRSPLKLGGDLSGWEGVKPITLNSREAVTCVADEEKNPWGGPEDLSVEWRIAYATDGLYLRADVNNNIFIPAKSVENAWDGDSIQLYFDLKAEGRDKRETGYSSCDETIWAAKINGEDVLYRDCAPEWQIAFVHSGLMKKGETKISRLNGRTIYEIKLPLEEIFPLEMKQGVVFGLGLLVNNANAQGARKQAMTNTPPKTEPHKMPELWPQAVLVGK